MKAIEWVTAELKKKDAALGSYLARFKKENEQLDEAALAEKLHAVARHQIEGLHAG